MKRFNFLQATFYLLIVVLFVSCNSSSEQKDAIKICPQCNMSLPKSDINTAIIKNNDKYYFDDVGCMVLYAKDNHIEFKKIDAKVFSNDTHSYINAKEAYYTINEETPMHYGFGAYKEKVKNSIDFDELILRMLRGENMANPKIRKQILGY